MDKKILAAEIQFIFQLIILRIWFFDHRGLISWILAILPVYLAVTSWVFQKNSLETLGFRPKEFWKDFYLNFFSFFILARLVTFAAEFAKYDFFYQQNLSFKFLKTLLLYYPWAFFQQLFLNGYFGNRIEQLTKNNYVTSLFGGFLFSLIHLPNPVLTPITFIGGSLSIFFFFRHQNLYTLAFFHALLATIIKYFLPMVWHHNLRIGPGFYDWHP